MLKAVGLLLIALSGDGVMTSLFRLFEGRLYVGTDALAFLIGIRLVITMKDMSSWKRFDRFSLTALGILLIVPGGKALTALLVGFWEGRLEISADLLLLIIGIGLIFAHPLWHKATRWCMVGYGTMLIAVTAITLAGFPDAGVWLTVTDAIGTTREAIPPLFIALYAAAMLTLLSWGYALLYKVRQAVESEKDLKEIPKSAG